MKSISGKEFAKAIERQGWSLLRVQGITSTGKREVTFGSPFLFMEIKLSKRGCSDT